MEKRNIAELLKDCPKGMELDCTMFEGVFLEQVDKNVEYPIAIRVGKTDVKHLTKEGCWNKYSNAKCVIFPKGKTSWEGFHRPFKDGDILAYTSSYTTVFIYRNKDNEPKHTTSFYVGYTIGCGCYCNFHIYNKSLLISLNGDCDTRFATEEEKEKLFQAIKDNGYKWNAETKTLEKLTPNKFDINTLVPFESKVLVRENKTDVWQPAFYGFFNQHNKRFYTASSGTWLMCIPYNEDTKHLTGTTDDCEEYFKTWK